jgi:hypothetical protein
MRFAREALSNFKAFLRAAAARAIHELREAIRIATDAFTQAECRN